MSDIEEIIRSVTTDPHGVPDEDGLYLSTEGLHKVLSAMPTGPWVEGDAPEEAGQYLICEGVDDFQVAYYSARSGWWNPFESFDNILRYAKIRTED